ncbi:PAS domain-containing sensor histidine kinase [Paenibacillus puerhi]|uniref:PAS domain-containing sensor histidine kinase n=1 Tax=Paenibacillus puerhi TaxID=2692622 RepID=UPI00135AE337|nr:PAS domain S-box protein [Paenibacillus puerhi]
MNPYLSRTSNLSLAACSYVLAAASVRKPLLSYCVPSRRRSGSTLLGAALFTLSDPGVTAAASESAAFPSLQRWSFSMTPAMLAIGIGMLIAVIFGLTLLFVMIGRQLRTSQSQHQSLFEQNPDMMFSVNTEGVILNTNFSVLQTIGYSKSSSVGRSFFPIVEHRDRELFHSFFQKSVEGNSCEFVIRLLHADGSVRDVFIRTVPMADEGIAQGVYIIGRDITETKANRETFERLSRTHSLILDSINEGVYGIDAKGGTVFWNAAAERMTGFSRSEVATLSIHQLFHHTKPDGTSYPEEDCPIMRSIRDETPVHIHDELLWRKDGTSFPAEYHVFPMRYENMQLGAVLTFIDITERKRTEELMLTSEKLSVAGQLAAGIAHEIRNPLTAIKGFLQLMNSGVAKKSYMDVIFSEMDRIELIINELLILAKPQPSKREEKPISPLLNHVITLLESQANIHNIQLVKEYEEPGPLILCDENQLKQVFINMIKNSIESMTDGGSITIRIKTQKPSGFSVEIEDQGCGIPRDRLSRIGEPFYSTKEKGTGLGLMVSKKIVEDHGGSLDISSEVHVGTRIEVSFPGSGLSGQPKEPDALV